MRRVLLPITLTVIAGIFWFSGRKSEAQVPASKPVTEDEQQAGPSIALSVNGLSSAVIAAGSPIVLEATIGTADGRDANTPLTLAGPSEGWGKLLKVDILKANGSSVDGIVTREAYATNATITLDGKTIGKVVWTVESSQPLVAGEYILTATLDSRQTSAPGWKGKAASPKCKLTVKASAAALTDGELTLASMAQSRVHFWNGRIDEALAVCDSFLKTHPDDGVMLEERGDMLAKAGRFKDAVAAYQVALSKVSKMSGKPTDEPPFALLRKLNLATKALIDN